MQFLTLPLLSRLYPSIALRFLFANLVFLNGSQILDTYYISVLADMTHIWFRLYGPYLFKTGLVSWHITDCY